MFKLLKSFGRFLKKDFPMDNFKYYFAIILTVRASGENIVFNIYVVSMYYAIILIGCQILKAFIKFNCKMPVVCKLLTR